MTIVERYQTISLETTQTDIRNELSESLTAPHKKLPSKLLYDQTGSELFEQICELPEYYLTRTERCILQKSAEAIVGQCPAELRLVELGSGSAVKTKFLIEACLKEQDELTYYPIDVSPAALDMAAQGLLPLFEELEIIGLGGEYESGLTWLEQKPDEPHLVAFLGSTIGNFTVGEASGFMSMLRSHLRPIDRLLLGYDLLKDASVLIPAYDDAQGITAQFNLNLLRRLNNEFGAEFDLSSFEHRAVFNAELSRIEMHLVSKRRQTVAIADLDLNLSFREGETIHTENSYKHSRAAMAQLLMKSGFHIEAEYTDSNQLFCLALLV